MYHLKLKELQNAIKNLNTRDNYVNYQKQILQRLTDQIKQLREDVKEPLEVISQII